MTIPELASRTGINESTLRSRLKRYPLEIAVQASPQRGGCHGRELVCSRAVQDKYRLSPASNAEKPPQTVLGELLAMQRPTDTWPTK